MGWKDKVVQPAAVPAQAGGWRSKVAQQEPQPLSERSLGDKLQTGLESFADTATLGYLPHLQAGAGSALGLGDYVQLRDENIARQKQQATEMPGAALAGKAAGIGANMLVPGKLPTMVAQAALANPGDVEGQISGPQIGERAGNAAIAGLLGGGLQLAGKGLGKAADYTMQKAARIARPKPGMGTELINQGVIGTEGMMAKQIASKIPQAGEELSEVVASHKGPVDTLGAIDQIRAKAEGLKVNGYIPESLQNLYNKYMSAADDLAKSVGPTEGGQTTAPLLQKFKQSMGDLSYAESGAAGNTQTAMAAKEAGGAARDVLSKAIGDPYEAANARISALLRGRHGLEKSMSLGDLALTGSLIGGGYAAGGPEGALLGALGRTGLAKSGGAHLLSLGGRAASSAAIPATRAYSLFGTEKDR